MIGGAIACSGLSRSFRDGSKLVRALRDVSFSVAPGERLAIEGRSGSGKSTLLGILACLELPDSGTYLLDGIDAGAMGEEQRADLRSRRISIVFQEFNLIDQLDVVENIGLPLDYRGVAPALIQSRAIAAALAVGLEARLDHRPKELSGGERQRVAIARALCAEPGLLLADEPTGNLDGQTASEILQLLFDLSERGATLIVVTHDPLVAGRFPRRLRLESGGVVDAGAA